MAEEKMVVLSESLVQDIAALIGSRPLQEVLPLFNRLVTETRGQLGERPLETKTDVEVPSGPPAKAEKPGKKK